MASSPSSVAASDVASPALDVKEETETQADEKADSPPDLNKSGSHLNPNAKAFVFNPNAKEFVFSPAAASTSATTAAVVAPTTSSAIASGSPPARGLSSSTLRGKTPPRPPSSLPSPATAAQQPVFPYYVHAQPGVAAGMVAAPGALGERIAVAAGGQQPPAFSSIVPIQYLPATSSATALNPHAAAAAIQLQQMQQISAQQQQQQQPQQQHPAIHPHLQPQRLAGTAKKGFAPPPAAGQQLQLPAGAAIVPLAAAQVAAAHQAQAALLAQQNLQIHAHQIQAAVAQQQQQVAQHRVAAAAAAAVAENAATGGAVSVASTPNFAPASANGNVHPQFHPVVVGPPGIHGQPQFYQMLPSAAAAAPQPPRHSPPNNGATAVAPAQNGSVTVFLSSAPSTGASADNATYSAPNYPHTVLVTAQGQPVTSGHLSHQYASQLSQPQTPHSQPQPPAHPGGVMVVPHVIKHGESPPEAAPSFPNAAVATAVQTHQPPQPPPPAAVHSYPPGNPAAGLIAPGTVAAGIPAGHPGASSQVPLLHQGQQPLTSPVLQHLVPIHHSHLNHPAAGPPGQMAAAVAPQQPQPTLPTGPTVAATPQGTVLSAVAPTPAGAGMQIIHAGNVAAAAAPANAHFMAAAVAAQQQQQQAAAAVAAAAGAAATVVSHGGNVVHVPPPPPAAYIQASNGGAPFPGLTAAPAVAAAPQVPLGSVANSHPGLHHHHHHPSFVASQSASATVLPPAQAAPAPPN